MATKVSKALESVRLDKWLWASRFFKTRKNAVEAISGGKVHLNGARTKPSRNIHIGDELDITRENYRYHVEIIALNDKRRPAAEAQLLYQETEESIKKREDERNLRRMSSANARQSDKKPTKKERRAIGKLKGW